MKYIKCEELSASQKSELLELWNNEYPEKLTYSSMLEFDGYLEKLSEPSHLLILDKNMKIQGWYFDFVRDEEKWFAIILNSDVQGKGLGTQILELAKQKESELNGWVIDHNRDIKRNGKYYNSPLDFYRKNGFEILYHCRLELPRISAVKINWKKK